MKLPIRCARFPISLRDASGELIPSEQSIISWLRAKPGLLGWRPNIRWLGPQPGGLLGIDSMGSLIVVRTVIDVGAAPDPFEKSAADIKSAAINRDWSAAALRAKWLKCSIADRFDREALRQCQPAYCTGGSTSCDDAHHRGVKRSLNMREAQGNPAPVFFGLIASPRPDFRLSRKAWKNLKTLQKQVGDERVGLRVISATIGSRLVRVQCRTPESTQPGSKCSKFN